MVRYDSVELGCTSVCALETDTCWNALIPVPPARLIVVEVYDCFPARLPEEGTSLRGKVTLSPAQLLELRQITRRQSGQQRRACLHQQIYTDVKVDYSMSHHKADREDKEDNKITGQMIPRVLLSMTDMAAAELPALTTSSSLLGRALRTTQLSYVVLRLLDRKARSSTTRVAGKRALWKNDSASIVVDESMLSEEPLHVQIWSERTALPDNLLGESQCINQFSLRGGHPTRWLICTQVNRVPGSMLSSVPKANQPQPHSRWGDPVIVTRGYYHAHSASNDNKSQLNNTDLMRRGTWQLSLALQQL